MRRSFLSAGVVVCSLIVSGCDSGTEPEADPTVATVAATAHPEIPAGLKVACFVAADTLEDSTTCPVVEWNGLTYWAYSHVDNRTSLSIAAYDSDGDLVMVWEKTGARYVWQITVDDDDNTITFHGQGSATITMTWEELRVTDGS